MLKMSLSAALLLSALCGCAGVGNPGTPNNLEMNAEERKRFAKMTIGVETLPPRPTGKAIPKDGPGCKETVKVINHKFHFRPTTVMFLQNAKLKPWVYYRHDIDAAGQATNIKLVKTAGYKAYDADALGSLKKWIFVLPAGKKSMTSCIASFAIT